MALNDGDFSFDPDDYTYQLRSTSTHTPITEEEKKQKVALIKSLQAVLLEWDNNHDSPGYDPIPHIKRMAEIIEEGNYEFLKKDPDPLDDRHPNRTHPQSAFGNLLKTLFRNDDFMNKLVISYILGRDNIELSIQSCRLLLNCVPGLDSNVVFSEPDDFVPKLYSWAKDSSNEYLQAYSMGLLASALEVQENASKYRMENAMLVPIALRRLKELKEKMEKERKEIEKKNGKSEFPYTNFAHLLHDEESSSSNSNEGSSTAIKKTVFENKEENQVKTRTRDSKDDDDSNSNQPPKKRRKTKNHQKSTNSSENIQKRIPSFSSLQNLDNSNSKWDILQPFLIGTHKVYPLTISMYQRLILQFLGPTGEYQDLLSMTYEGNAMDLIIDYIDLEKSQDVRLTFDALKYLTSLLVHRKFALEFVNANGVEYLLKIPRTSLASVGVVTSLYYISYNSDVMETVCQLNDRILNELVNYVLWCLEHSHESGMASASMFFAHAVYYKTILDRFDEMDGPRKLYNYISTLTLIQDTAADEHFELSEEQIHTSTQCVRNACNAFRSYTAAHLFLKLESFRKTMGNRHISGLAIPASLIIDIPNYKSLKVNEEHILECQKVLTNIFRITNASWRPIEDLRRLGVVKTMIGVRVLSKDWNTNATTGKSEMAINAIEVIGICCCLPKVQAELVESHRFVHSFTDGIAMLLYTADTNFEEGNVRIAALRVLIICLNIQEDVWKRLENKHRLEVKKISKLGSSPIKSLIDVLWASARKSNGIMILTELINAKVPISDADSIRTHACIVLTGMARCEQIRQLLSKMPLIDNNGLHTLMREPVAQDKRTEHVQFCREATNLLQVVTGKNMQDQQAKDLTQEKMQKQWIVENTKISYNEKELLQLIQEHLNRKGLTATASLLRQEADLPDVPASRVPATPIKLMPLPSSDNLLSIESSGSTLEPKAGKESEIRGIAPRKQSTTVASSSSHELNDDVFATPTSITRSKSIVTRTSTNSTSGTGGFPRRFYISPMKPKSIQNGESSQVLKPFRSLDDILAEYFRQQHSHCANPVTTCPPFSLFYPHRCPEPNKFGSVSANISNRIVAREIGNPHGRMISTWQDERYVFGRFRPARLIHEHEETYTSSAFSVDDEHMIIGFFSGEVHWMNIETGADESMTNCHNSAVTNIEPSIDGTMLLTSSQFVRPLSALWRLGHAQEMLRVFHDDQWIKFSNLSTAMIVGTSGPRATVYDTETNHALYVFNSPNRLRFEQNIASFSPCDQLVLNNGLLWDLRSSHQSVHTFDKLSPVTLSGVFHPHGNQVIINTEVYDVRNYKILHHVPALDQCQIRFNSTGNMMYAAVWEDTENDFIEKQGTSSFRTFDTSDYSVITTMDTKRPLMGLCASSKDQMVAVIEKLRPIHHEYSTHSSSQIRIFEVGKLKDAEDDVDEGDDEDEDNNDDDDDDEEGSESEDGSEMELSINPSEEDLDAEDAQVLREFEEQFFGNSSGSRSYSNSRSDGWVTASDEDGAQSDADGLNEPYGSSGSDSSESFTSSANSDEGEDDHDSSYEPEVQNDYNSTSSTALNPHLRRQNQNR